MKVGEGWNGDTGCIPPPMPPKPPFGNPVGCDIIGSCGWKPVCCGNIDGWKPVCWGSIDGCGEGPGWNADGEVPGRVGTNPLNPVVVGTRG